MYEFFTYSFVTVSIQGQRPNKNSEKAKASKTLVPKKIKASKMSSKVEVESEMKFPAPVAAARNANAMQMCLQATSSTLPAAASVPPMGSWTAQLKSSLHPATSSAPSSGLEALLTSASQNINNVGSQSIGVKRSVLGAALQSAPSNAQVTQDLNHLLSQATQQPHQTSAILSLLNNNNNNNALSSLFPAQATPAPQPSAFALLQAQGFPIPAMRPKQNDQLLGDLLQQIQQQQQRNEEEEKKRREHQMLVHLLEQVLRKQDHATQSVGNEVQQATRPSPQAVSAGLTSNQEQSRFGETTKAHVLAGVVGDGSASSGQKRSFVAGELLISDSDNAQSKKTKREESVVTQHAKPGLERHSTHPVLLHEDICPEDALTHHLVKIFAASNETDLKHHFGLQALIRELIATALSTRSFRLLSRASDLAIQFGIDMDRILCGVDADAAHSKDCIGGRMIYLLPMLLEPRAAPSRRNDECTMLKPQLPLSLLSYIAPPSCASFESMDVGNRWIMIRETNQGNTKVYCSPMFEKNVLSQAHAYQVEHHLDTDVFSLVFSKAQYNRFLAYLAQQVASQSSGDSGVCPVQIPTTIVRLLSKSWAENGHVQITKGMLDKTELNKMPTVDVSMMFTSKQTMDKHVYYLEFFSPDRDAGSQSLFNRITPTPNQLLPPSYDEVMKHWSHGK